jgi:hypothetical protein
MELLQTNELLKSQGKIDLEDTDNSEENLIADNDNNEK